MIDSINTEERSASEEIRASILDALGLSLSTKRREAIAARSASGIEKAWEEDEAHYQGYDDHNKHEFTSVSQNKSSLRNEDSAPKRKGSTVFPNITQPYVDAAAARIGDTLIPSDDRNFVIEPSPIADLLPEDVPQLPAIQAEVAPQQPGGQPAVPEAQQQMIMRPDGSQIPLIELDRNDKAKEAEAKRKAEKAQKRIDDWLTESAFHDEVRIVLDDAARIGSGVIKGPVPMVRTRKQLRQTDDGGTELVILEEIKPGSRQISAWNLFPHGACGESIHNGSYIFERDFLSDKKLRALKKDETYIKDQIDLCLEEGPRDSADNGGVQSDVTASTKDQFAIWYFHGDLTADELEAAGVELPDGEKDSFPAMITMVNDRVIHAALNPLDSGGFPYDVVPWKRRPGMPWGMGVSRQMRTPQRIVTAATRNLMDNAGRAAGPQFVLRRGIEPKDGIYEIVPDKIWLEGDDADGQSGPPFLSVVIPMLQNELSMIIQMGMKMAEDVTGMPQLMQGSQGAAPDTVGGMQILNNNANAVLRRIARLFDARLTKPHISRYIDWLNEYGEDNDEKGDFNCIARGSTALVERDIQNQEMVNIVQMTLNPAFGKNPEKAMDEFLRSRRFDPTAFDYTDDEKAKRAAQPPQSPPQIEVANIRAKADAEKTQFLAQQDQQKTQALLTQEKELAQLENQTEQTRIKVDTDRDLVLVQAQQQKNAEDAKARMAELQVRKEIEILKYSTQQQISLADAKTQLARDTMKLNVTRELAAASNALSAHKHITPPAKPVIEPAGRATPGNSYAQ